MLAEMKVGPQVNADGSVVSQRASRDACTVNQDGHAKYQEPILRGNCWLAANSAVQALSLNSATATGLILSNPAGSNKNIIVIEICVAIAAAVTGVANVVLTANVNPIAAATAHTTPLTVRNALLGASGTAVGLADSSATLPVAPSIIRPLMGWHWVTAGTPTTGLFVKDQLEGSVVVAPGCTVSIQGLTVAHTVLASIMWEEVPV